MKNDREQAEIQRERLRHEEQKKNPTGNFSDSVNRSQVGGLVDLVNSLGWKGTGLIIIFIVIIFLVLRLFVF